jgi:two-component sensor histidine kinase
VSIEDDGRGLPPDFDPAGDGSLGIAIVRTLVESELDGRITFGPVRQEGRRPGTRATVTLPLVTAAGSHR